APTAQTAPKGRQKRHFAPVSVAPSGLCRLFMAHDPGLTPRAIDERPFGAQDPKLTPLLTAAPFGFRYWGPLGRTADPPCGVTSCGARSWARGGCREVAGQTPPGQPAGGNPPGALSDVGRNGCVAASSGPGDWPR